MAKVTSKLQVTLPKALAEQYGIRPGDEIDWVAAGESVRVLPRNRAPERHDVEFRLRLFDEGTRRQLRRQEGMRISKAQRDRGWTREELYERGRAR